MDGAIITAELLIRILLLCPTGLLRTKKSTTPSPTAVKDAADKVLTLPRLCRTGVVVNSFAQPTMPYWPRYQALAARYRPSSVGFGSHLLTCHRALILNEDMFDRFLSHRSAGRWCGSRATLQRFGPFRVERTPEDEFESNRL